MKKPKELSYSALPEQTDRKFTIRPFNYSMKKQKESGSSNVIVYLAEFCRLFEWAQ